MAFRASIVNSWTLAGFGIAGFSDDWNEGGRTVSPWLAQVGDITNSISKKFLD
jgi:hypothetical protein